MQLLIGSIKMKAYLLLLLALASCATFAPHPVRTSKSEPITTRWPTYISPAEKARLRLDAQIFDGHPPVVVMDLEAAPDSIATVEAEYWMGVAKKKKP
jgi:hypothetical protein